MTTNEWLQVLTNNASLPLVFEYQSGKYVEMAYHITEIKNTQIESVDCGANMHRFDQTVVQLWLSGGEKVENYMSAGKAKKIFDLVQTKTQLNSAAEVLFEYGNQETPVIIYSVDQVEVQSNRLLVKLALPTTACKPKLQLETIGCQPGGGCC